MASRRRKAAEEKLRQKSPAKRSSRRKARDGESPKGKTEEICSYKTPKRPSRACLPTFSSPANETDAQQEIFWDPHSPIACKLGSGRKKQTAGRSTVEISEIVDRIAPQEEKPSCHDGSLLGMWIGDDAIPCTPGIAKVRARTKVHNARGLQLKHKEEELMKLAKQFDKNLTEAIQEQDASCHNAIHFTSEAKVSAECQGGLQTENVQQFLGEFPQIDAALQFGVAKENAETTECCERSSQKSIDLDAEVALNALFDCSPQKCSGRLSPGSSISDFHDSQNTLLAGELISEETADARGSMALDAHQRKGPASASTCRAAIPAEKPKMAVEQTFQSTVVSKTEPAVSSNVVSDDLEDWDTDLLADDSFAMQITQNPEVIGTPHESCKTKERAEPSARPNSAPCTFLKSSNDVPASHSVQKQSNEFGVTKTVSLQSDFHLKNNMISSISKSSQNRISGCDSIPVKAEAKSGTEGFTRLKSTSVPGKETSLSVHSNLSKPLAGKSRRNMSTIYSELSVTFAKPKPNDQEELANQASSSHLRAGAEKHVPSFGDRNEPRISDKVLNLFCESDGLWGANCEDDDLLYQVCDDVERNTQSQGVAKENVKATLMVVSAAKMETDPGHLVPKQELANCPQPQKSHVGRKTFSFNAPLTTTALRKNENSANPCVQRSCAPFKNESIPGATFRSNLVSEQTLASGSGSVPISNTHQNTHNSTQWQNVTCKMGKVQNISSNQVSNEKSKYVFRKASNSQALPLGRSGAPMALGESKNGPNILLHTAAQSNPKPIFKRHLSDSFAHSETEQKSRKCSQEEIARKKHEALERRKCKMQALLKNTAPT